MRQYRIGYTPVASSSRDLLVCQIRAVAGANRTQLLPEAIEAGLVVQDKVGAMRDFFASETSGYIMFPNVVHGRGRIRYTGRVMDSDLEAITKKILPILKEAGVTRAAFFGSETRGEANDESDLDLLVELPEGSSLLDLAGLKLRLEAGLGRSVDVLTFSSVHPRLRPCIERDQVPIL